MSETTPIDLFHRLSELNQIGIALSREKDIKRLLEAILVAAKKITNADGGTLYRMHNDGELRFEIVLTDSEGSIIAVSSLAARMLARSESIDSSRTLTCSASAAIGSWLPVRVASLSSSRSIAASRSRSSASASWRRSAASACSSCATLFSSSRRRTRAVSRHRPLSRSPSRCTAASCYRRTVMTTGPRLVVTNWRRWPPSSRPSRPGSVPRSRSACRSTQAPSSVAARS